MAYIDEATGGGSKTFLCLHGQPTWSIKIKTRLLKLNDFGVRFLGIYLQSSVIKQNFNANMYEYHCESTEGGLKTGKSTKDL